MFQALISCIFVVFNNYYRGMINVLKYRGRIISALLFVFIIYSCQDSLESTQTLKSSFAIVIDQETYDQVEPSLQAYKNMLEGEGMNVVILNDEWETADDIRKELKSLYDGEPKLEGAVFIGDVPIPHIMNAQHLTTAYKRNQERYPLHIAAVPSDRFYDDFDLVFDFIEKDSIRTNNYYYNLSADSPQYIHSDIYSGRIKPSIKEGENKYDLIRQYLEKVVAVRNTELDFMMSFTGHGYNSEDMNAWTGEKIALREQFPKLYTPQGRIEFLEFGMDEFMKPFLLNRLQDPELDIALLHEHGADDLQLISGTPDVSSVPLSIENVKMYLRSKLRDAKRRGNDLEETKQRYMDTYDVPEDWFDGTFTREMEERDSLYNYNMDIYLDDIYNIKPEAKFIMFDACFNGSFHQERYIAGEYVFGSGSTMVAHANTVNALQDKWPDEMLGLLGLGVRVGNWAKQINTLETHLIGDPTYYFKSGSDLNYNQVILAGNENEEVWRELIQSEYPDLQCLAISNLFSPDDQEFASQLKQIYLNSNSFVVRMECLKQLYKYNDTNFKDVLKKAIEDPYEYIRRIAASMIGDTGDNQMVGPLLNSIFNDKYSKRTMTNAYGSLDFMDPEEVKVQLPEIALKYSYMSNSSELKDELLKRVNRQQKGVVEEFDYIKDEEGVPRYKMLNITTLRNYHYHYMIPDYLILLDEDIEDSLKIALIEALGWYVNSVYNDLIIEKCNELIAAEHFSTDIKNEAKRTISRLKVYQ
ncbi:HEAT repeat domain-containing protein [Maribellus maritimus]|uniref:HEAT repeat domain-containing protein n=1 Tax=Maribellus maritimus TaxID=2870838 RepID=UPI001EEA84EE|nr:HEAT repeat domain-containing protein [Maribellus maritimus]MCG6186232.1 hypothetical protein [Maribellus maritimus]